MQNLSTVKRLFSAMVIVIVGMLGTLLVTYSHALSPSGSVFFNPSSSTLFVGGSVDVVLEENSNEGVDAMNVTMNFPTGYLSCDGSSADGTKFNLSYNISCSNGTVQASGHSSQASLAGTQVLGMVVLHSTGQLGTANLSFSNASVFIKGTSQNLITSKGTAQYPITNPPSQQYSSTGSSGSSGSSGGSSPSPSPAPKPAPTSSPTPAPTKTSSPSPAPTNTTSGSPRPSVPNHNTGLVNDSTSAPSKSAPTAVALNKPGSNSGSNTSNGSSTASNTGSSTGSYTGSSTGSSTTNQTLKTKKTTKHSSLALTIFLLIIFFALIGGAVYYLILRKRRASGGSYNDYDPLVAPTAPPAPAAPPIVAEPQIEQPGLPQLTLPKVEQPALSSPLAPNNNIVPPATDNLTRHINEAFYPAMAKSNALQPKQSQTDMLDMFDVSRVSPESYGNPELARIAKIAREAKNSEEPQEPPKNP